MDCYPWYQGLLSSLRRLSRDLSFSPADEKEFINDHHTALEKYLMGSQTKGLITHRVVSVPHLTVVNATRVNKELEATV